jgi:hypothetical protein
MAGQVGPPWSGNSSSYWFVDEALLFFQCSLDPNQEYNISLTASSSSGLSFESFTVYQNELLSLSPSEPPPTEVNTHAGVIAGSVISGLVFLVIVSGCCVWCCRRRKNATFPPFVARKRSSLELRRTSDPFGLRTTNPEGVPSVTISPAPDVLPSPRPQSPAALYIPYPYATGPSSDTASSSSNSPVRSVVRRCRVVL